MSVKNFSPLLLDIFRLGHEKEFVFECETDKKAIALRARLHKLRREMRKEKHWMIGVAEAVVISIRGSTLIAHPPDNDLSAKLEKALIDQGLKKDKLT